MACMAKWKMVIQVGCHAAPGMVASALNCFPSRRNSWERWCPACTRLQQRQVVTAAGQQAQCRRRRWRMAGGQGGSFLPVGRSCHNVPSYMACYQRPLGTCANCALHGAIRAAHSCHDRCQFMPGSCSMLPAASLHVLLLEQTQAEHCRAAPISAAAAACGGSEPPTDTAGLCTP